MPARSHVGAVAGRFEEQSRTLREAAKAGQEPAAALQELFAQVKQEGPTSATAMEAFGKSGLAVASAVAQGKLDYDAFAAALASNQGTINDTASSTDDGSSPSPALARAALPLMSVPM